MAIVGDALLASILAKLLVHASLASVDHGDLSFPRSLGQSSRTSRDTGANTDETGNAQMIELTVNGTSHTVSSDPRRTLLDVLREDLKLTGTKYGCGEGACGACTVLLDGQPVVSCLVLIGEAQGRAVTTIEGLAAEGALHPVQEALLLEGMQCGYCAPGMVLLAAALLKENPEPTDEEIVRWMGGNLCRCGGYRAVLRAIRHAVGPGARNQVQVR